MVLYLMKPPIGLIEHIDINPGSIKGLNLYRVVFMALECTMYATKKTHKKQKQKKA